MRFALTGSYDGEEALATFDNGQIGGYPSALTEDLQVALQDPEPEAATPTGPFYDRDTPQGVYLTMLDVLDPDAPVEGWGEVPTFPDDGDELDDGQPPERAQKAQVHVRPYLREGRPVAGYTRLVDDVSVPGEPPIKQSTLEVIKRLGIDGDPNDIPRGPKARKLFGTHRDSEELYLGPSGKYPPVRREMHERIVAEFFKGRKPKPPGERRALVTAGGGASGKSVGLRANPKVIPDDVVVVNPDEIKLKMDEWHYLAPDEPSAANVLHEESSYIARLVMERAVEQGYNVLLDVVGDSEQGKFAEKLKLLHDNGYHVSVMMADAPMNIAIDRNIKRSTSDPTHIDYGRIVPVQVQKYQHREAIKRVHDWWRSPHVDQWQIYRTTEFPGVLVAQGGGGAEPEIVNETEWQSMMDKAAG